MVKNRFLCAPPHTHTLQKRLARCLSPDSNAIQSLVFRSSSETGFWPVPCEQKTQVSFSSLGNESCPTLCIWFLTAGDVVPAVYKWGEPKRRLLQAAMGFWREQDTGTYSCGRGPRWSARAARLTWLCVFLNPTASDYSRKLSRRKQSSCQQWRWQAAWRERWFLSRKAASSSLTLSLAIVGVETYFLLYLPDAAWTDNKL